MLNIILINLKLTITKIKASMKMQIKKWKITPQTFCSFNLLWEFYFNIACWTEVILQGRKKSFYSQNFVVFDVFCGDVFTQFLSYSVACYQSCFCIIIILEILSCEGWTETEIDGSVYFCIDDFLNTTLQMRNSCSLVSWLFLFVLIGCKFLFE